MSTNYYLRFNICNHCNRYDELHLGKYNQGRKFLFEVIRHKFPIYEWSKDAKNMLKDNTHGMIILNSFKTLKDFLDNFSEIGNLKIYDEYDKCIDIEEFYFIVERTNNNDSNIDGWREVSHLRVQETNAPFEDKDGYEFSNEAFE